MEQAALDDAGRGEEGRIWPRHSRASGGGLQPSSNGGARDGAHSLESHSLTRAASELEIPDCLKSRIVSGFF